MKNQELYNEISNLENELERCQVKLLADNGWKRTSRTPGSYWMWEKELVTGKLLVNQETALRIQSDLDGGLYDDMEKKETNG
jgi:hypothetical protein